MFCDQVTDEVAGVVRWKRYLDFLIFSFFKQDVRDYDRMEPLLRQVIIFIFCFYFV
jgi:16S rRNA (cytosine967-C5)-methyltransferase